MPPPPIPGVGGRLPWLAPRGRRKLSSVALPALRVGRRVSGRRGPSPVPVSHVAPSSPASRSLRGRAAARRSCAGEAHPQVREPGASKDAHLGPRAADAYLARPGRPLRHTVPRPAGRRSGYVPRGSAGPMEHVGDSVTGHERRRAILALPRERLARAPTRSQRSSRRRRGGRAGSSRVRAAPARGMAAMAAHETVSMRCPHRWRRRTLGTGPRGGMPRARVPRRRTRREGERARGR